MPWVFSNKSDKNGYPKKLVGVGRLRLPWACAQDAKSNGSTHLFMQNEPNLRKPKMNINYYKEMCYKENCLCEPRKNEPKRTQFRTQILPPKFTYLNISTQNPKPCPEQRRRIKTKNSKLLFPFWLMFPSAVQPPVLGWVLTYEIFYSFCVFCSYPV